MPAWLRAQVSANDEPLCSLELLPSRTLTGTFLRELKVLVHQLLASEPDEDLIALINYLAVNRCRKVRVCDEDDDLSLYLLESLVTGKETSAFCASIHRFCCSKPGPTIVIAQTAPVVIVRFESTEVRQSNASGQSRHSRGSKARADHKSTPPSSRAVACSV